METMREDLEVRLVIEKHKGPKPKNYGGIGLWSDAQRTYQIKGSLLSIMIVTFPEHLGKYTVHLWYQVSSWSPDPEDSNKWRSLENDSMVAKKIRDLGEPFNRLASGDGIIDLDTWEEVESIVERLVQLEFTEDELLMRSNPKWEWGGGERPKPDAGLFP